MDGVNTEGVSLEEHENKMEGLEFKEISLEECLSVLTNNELIEDDNSVDNVTEGATMTFQDLVMAAEKKVCLGKQDSFFVMHLLVTQNSK